MPTREGYGHISTNRPCLSKADTCNVVGIVDQDSASARLYFSSQRGTDGKTGMTFEVVGPF